MGGIVTARVPLLVEHGDRRIQTTRLPRAVVAFREGLGGIPATQRARTHADLPGDLRHRQPLLPQGAGLLVLTKALGPTSLPRRVRPPPRRGIRINVCVVRRARRGKHAWRERLREYGGRVPRQRRLLT